jgi:hypothetical protein
MELDSFLDLEKCPHCGTDTPTLELHQQSFYTESSDKYEKRMWGIYVCKRCGGVVTASARMPNAAHVPFIVHEIYPYSKSLDESIPTKPRTFLKQAIDSLHSPSGSIMLAASSVDAMLIEKGFNNDTLYGKIKSAVEEHKITQEMADWAHEVRLNANSERHPKDDIESATTEDAKRTVEFAKAMAEFLFVLPSKVQRGIEAANSAEQTKHSAPMQGGRGIK